MKARITQPSVPSDGCHVGGGTAAPPITSAPAKGILVWPKIPMAAHARHDAIVNPTTHGLRRRVASEIAPKRGTDNTTRIDEMLLPSAYKLLDAPRSLMNQ